MILFFILTLAILLFSRKFRAGILDVPTAVSIVFLLWLLPQLTLLRTSSVDLMSRSDLYAIISALSLVAILGGWMAAKTSTRRPLIEAHRAGVVIGRYPGMAITLVAATLLSAILAVLLERYRGSVDGVQQWSGPITIINFFAQLRILSLAPAAIFFFRRITRFSTALFCANLAIVLPIVLIYMRRSELIELIFVLAGAYWFTKHRLPSLFILIPVGVFSIIMIFAVADMRRYASETLHSDGRTTSLFSADLWANINIGEIVEARASQAPDIMNGIYIVDYVASSGSYGFGARVWNGIVFQWVPAQLVGASVKKSLMIGSRGSVYGEIESRGNFKYDVGTTSTGIGSAFEDFGFLAPFCFAFIAYLMGRLFRRSMGGDLWDQVLYLVLLPTVLTSITHGYELFFITAPLFIGFWLMFRMFSRYRFVFSQTRAANRRFS